MKFRTMLSISLVSLLAVGILGANLVQAATSEIYISSNSDGERGPDINISDGTSTVSGENGSTSTNTLYVCGQTKGGISASTFGNRGLAPNSKPFPWGATNIIKADYHVLLDPSGALMKGCWGNGKITD